MIGWLFALAIAATAGAIRRNRIASRVDGDYRRRHPSGDDGIAIGAEPFFLEGTNGRALLLLHGSGDTPQTLRYLGDRLHEAGYTVYGPLLPGHGRSPLEFIEVTAEAYTRAAQEALGTLREKCLWIGVVGLSMGGAIVAQLAADSTDVRLLVLLSPYLIPPPSVKWIAWSGRGWGLLHPFLAGRGAASVHDPAASRASHAYGVFPPSALRALVATAKQGYRAMARIEVPTLIVNSRQDNRIPAELATRATKSLRAPTERHWVSGCGHVITVDYCRAEVADLVLSFLGRHTD